MSPRPGLEPDQRDIAIGIVANPDYARVMRASVLATREADYIAASRAPRRVVRGAAALRRILPKSLTPLIVQATLGIGGAIPRSRAVVISSVEPRIAEWGGMIALDRNPHQLRRPTCCSSRHRDHPDRARIQLLGHGLRDALDPRLNAMSLR